MILYLFHFQTEPSVGNSCNHVKKSESVSPRAGGGELSELKSETVQTVETQYQD